MWVKHQLIQLIYTKKDKAEINQRILLDNSCSFFKDPILNIAEGLVLDMCPSGCQLGGAEASGQLQ